MNDEEIEKLKIKAKKEKELRELKPISFAELQATFDKWMILPDRGVLKLLCALYRANKFSRKGIWVILIAPSGGGKTELLNSLISLPDIYEVSLLTPNTFLSGMPGKADCSLLPKVSGKILLFKDWTTVLSMQRDARAEIMAQLREIWDGKMKKPFGNGKVAEWEGKVSLLVASTQAVDMNQQMFTHLGERFLNYRIQMPCRKEVAMRSLNNDSRSVEMGWELQKAMYAFMKTVDFEKNEFPPLPEDIKTKLVDLADFCTMARSGVIRDFDKEVVFVPASEMPTRIVQQLHGIACGLYAINGQDKYLPEDLDILYKVALDSIPQTNKMVIAEMAKAPEQSTKEIAIALGYPTGPIKMYLENLAMLKVCTRIKGSETEEGGAADRWTLKPEFTEIIRIFEKIEPLTLEERKKRKEEIEEAPDQDFADFEEAVTTKF